MSKSIRIEGSRSVTARNTISTDVRAVEVDEDEWENALAKYGKEIRVSGNPLQQARELMGAAPNISMPADSLAWSDKPLSLPGRHERGRRALSLRVGHFSPQEDYNLTSHEGRNYSSVGPEEMLTFAYGNWCEHQGEGRDCLSLLTEGTTLSIDGKRSLALQLAFGSVWEETKEAFRDMANPEELRNVVMFSITMYLALWLVPEPTTKAIAAIITAALFAYLGVDTIWTIFHGYRAMARRAEVAQTFDELCEAADDFGRILGQDAARIFVMIATVAIGSTAGLAARIGRLPGATAAAASFESQTGGLSYSSIGTVQAVSMNSSGFTISLAPGATFMSSNDMDPVRPDRLSEDSKRPSTQGSTELVSQVQKVSKEKLKQLRAEFRSAKKAFWKREAQANPGKYTEEDLAKMRNGDPPTGPDGKSMELHHKVPLSAGGTNDLSNLEIMTQTGHRVGPNFRLNHPKK